MTVAGAGGSWQVQNERQDPRVVPQTGALFCGCACAETIAHLLRVTITATDQGELSARFGGAPFTVDSLSFLLNEQYKWVDGTLWQGGSVDGISKLSKLNATGPWIAVFWPRLAKIGHFVVVVDMKDSNTIEILDPWQPGTSYTMTVANFDSHWNLQCVVMRRT